MIVTSLPTILATTASPPPRPQSEAPACLHLLWHTQADCALFADHLAALLQPALLAQAQVVLELRGPLGAGKTTFTRHLLQALGVQGRIKSPSYAVVEPHETGDVAMWHFDFYRFNDPHEWEDAGLRDIFGAPGLKVVEWPDQAAGLLPPADLCLNIAPGADELRQVALSSCTPQGERWLAQLVATGSVRTSGAQA